MHGFAAAGSAPKELFVVFFMVCRYFGGDYHPGGQFYDPKNSASSTGELAFELGVFQV